MPRPRTQGPREPNGRLSRSIPDTGTAETSYRRAQLAGANGDQTLTSAAIGVVYNNTMAPRGSDPQPGWHMERAVYDAAIRYAYLYETLYGRVTATAQKLESCIGHAGAGEHRVRAENFSDNAAQRMQQAYEAAQIALGDYDSKVMYESVVVFDQIPEWLGVDGMDELRLDWMALAEKVAVALGFMTVREK